MKAMRWLVTLAYAGVIFYLSSRTWGGVDLFPHSDKVIHTLMYAGLGFLCVWSLCATSLRGRAAILPLAATMAIIYGISDEIHQMFVPGREASVFDLAADAAGAILGAMVAVWVARRIRREA